MNVAFNILLITIINLNFTVLARNINFDIEQHDKELQYLNHSVATDVFLANTTNVINRCKVKCGETEGVECVANAFADDEVLCGCKNVDEIFVDKDHGCKVNRCKVKCGEKEDVICVGDVFGFDDVLCGCTNLDKIFVDKDQGCKGPCTSIPCLNGGTCQVRNGTFHCECDPSHYGKYCEIAHICITNPCRNGGTCHIRNSTYQCECSKPYYGSFCERDPCSENPCQNGGSCLVRGSTFMCFCKKPYAGLLCESDPCFWNTCQNEGICKVSENGGVKCFCKDSFMGKNCEIQSDGIISRNILIIAVLVTFIISSTFLTSCFICLRTQTSKYQG